MSDLKFPEIKGCGKLPETRNNARGNANYKSKKGRNLQTYYCKLCDAWHLTNMSPKKEKQKIERQEALLHTLLTSSSQAKE